MTSSHFVIFLKGDLLQIFYGLEVIIRYFCFTEFGVIELSWLFCFIEFGVIELFRVDFTKFSVLDLFWNLHTPLFLWIGSAQICHACYLFFLTWLEVAVPVSVFILFLVDPVPFNFSRNLCRFFSCFVCSIPIFWPLTVVARALVSDVCFISI